MTIVDVQEVEGHLDEYLDSIASGEEVQISRGGKVVARLIAAKKRSDNGGEALAGHFKDATQAAPKVGAPVQKPDIMARLRIDYPDGPLADDYASKYILEERENGV